MTTTRTDAHRPAELVTEDYEFTASFDNKAPSWPAPPAAFEQWRAEFDRLRAMVATSPVQRGLSQCHHCGAHLRYVAVLRHEPTGQHIAVGETCLDNRFGQATADFHRMRKAAELDRKAQRIRGLVAEFVAANEDLAFMADKDHEHTNSFVADVARKLRLYGELTERQVEAVRKAVARDAERADNPPEVEPTAPVVEGRQVITGRVLTVKFQEGYYGSTLKMLVRDDRGFKVWGSVPASLDTGNNGVDRGDMVRFTATVERSEQDETFGYFKRPTKAEVLATAEVAS